MNLNLVSFMFGWPPLVCDLWYKAINWILKMIIQNTGLFEGILYAAPPPNGGDAGFYGVYLERGVRLMRS